MGKYAYKPTGSNNGKLRHKIKEFRFKSNLQFGDEGLYGLDGNFGLLSEYAADGLYCVDVEL